MVLRKESEGKRNALFIVDRTVAMSDPVAIVVAPHTKVYRIELRPPIVSVAWRGPLGPIMIVRSKQVTDTQGKTFTI